jgi:sec-independent protein translocase protein TatA
MPDIGIPEMLIILAILLLLFGSRALPKLSRSIGESARELRRGLAGEKDDNTKKKTAKTKADTNGQGSSAA